MPDWAALVNDLLALEGMTEAKIAEAVGASQPTIHRIKRGQVASPKFETAQALIDLHRRLCAAPFTAVPG